MESNPDWQDQSSYSKMLVNTQHKQCTRKWADD